MLRFSKKVALITGAASGIGRATAIRLSSEGANLILCDLDNHGLSATLDACQTDTNQIIKQNCDVSDYVSCQSAINECIAQFGKLDILCNIAGIAKVNHFTDISPDDWHKMVNINLSSVFYFSQLAMPHLINTKGNIVNMASSAGLVGQAYTSAYSATKAAIISLSKSLAIEYSGQTVRVNAICPGNVKTALSKSLTIPEDIDKRLLSKMFPLLEAAQASEIAAAVAYIASDEARYITGTAFAIDGGQTAG